MSTQQRPLFGPKVGPVIVAGPVAVIVLAVGVIKPHPVWYVAGCCLLAVALLLTAHLVAYRAVWSTTRHATIAGVGAVVVAAVTALVPFAIAHQTYSSARWRAHYDRTAYIARVGDRVYITRYPSDHQVRDPDSGHLLASVPYAGGLSVAGDDSFTASGDVTTYYDATGKERWHRNLDNAQILAIHDGNVFLDRCGERRTGCAVGPTGTIVWRGRQRVIGWLGGDGSDTVAQSGAETAQDGIAGAPEVAVANLAGDRAAVYAADGRPIATVRGEPLGVAGDLVLVSQGRCEITALRGGRQVWRRQLPSCATGPTGLKFILLQRHLFVDSADMESTYAVDLSDSSIHRFGRLDPDYLKLGIPGDDVVVERNLQHLTGRDPDTGRVLWKHDAEEGSARVRIENGAVTIFGETSPARRWLLQLCGRGDNSRESVEVLDARTGKVTGRMATGQVWTSGGIGPGRAAVVGDGLISVTGH